MRKVLGKAGQNGSCWKRRQTWPVPGYQTTTYTPLLYGHTREIKEALIPFGIILEAICSVDQNVPNP